MQKNDNWCKIRDDSIFFRTKELVDEITEPESESRDSNNPPKVFDINMSTIIKKALNYNWTSLNMISLHKNNTKPG